MRRHFFIMAAVAGLLLAAGSAEARRYGRRSSSSGDATHGQRAYRDALRFAQQHNLPHFTVRSRGVDRVVVNVPNDKLSQWCQTFSKGKCYIEPFFNASNRRAPNWSMLRMGKKTFKKYGTGSQYRCHTGSCRVAFPMSLSQGELRTTENVIKTSQNGRFHYNGGNPHTHRNCTNWLTYKVGQYTGVRTNSVKHHMKSLVSGYHSPRMTVMAVMTPNKMQNFGQDQLQMQWGHH